MRNSGLIILVVFILLSVGFYVGNKQSFSPNKNDVIKPTPTPTPMSTSSPSATPTVFSEPDATIEPGESASVQCGEGNAGTRVTFNEGGFAGNIGLGGQAYITAKVSDEKGQSVGGLVEWNLYDRGTLQIEECKATFIAPDSIGTAYSTSATINARIVPNTKLTPAPTPAGEGGPINAGFVTTTKITILSGAKATCFDPAGVAISINSVPTTSNVQIRVDTPTVVGRVYNRRNATVRDGVGTYEIEIFVNGALYGQTRSQVEKCQLPPVKF